MFAINVETLIYNIFKKHMKSFYCLIKCGHEYIRYLKKDNQLKY